MARRDRLKAWLENPIVHYGAPHRRSILHAAVLVLMVLAITGAMAAFGYYVWREAQTSMGGIVSGPSTYFVMGMSLAGFISTVLAPVIFLNYVRDYRRGDTLEQLYLTGMPPRDVARASLFWGVLVALLLPLLFTLGFLATTAFVPWQFSDSDNYTWQRVAGGGWVQVPPSPFTTGDSWRSLNLSLLLIVLPTVVALIRCVRGWLMLSMARWRVVLTAPLWGMLATTVVLVTINLFFQMQNSSSRLYFRGGLLSYLDSKWPLQRPFEVLLVLIPVVIVVAWTGWQTVLARAAGFYFRSVDEELLLRADWLAREQAARPLLSADPRGLRPHRSMVLQALLPHFLIATIGVLLILNLIGFLVRGQGIGGLFANFPFIIILLGLFAVALMVWWRERSPQPEFPVVSGALVPSVVGWYLPIMPAVLAGVEFVLFFNAGGAMPSTGAFWLACAILMAGYVMRTARAPRSSRAFPFLALSVLLIYFIVMPTTRAAPTSYFTDAHAYMLLCVIACTFFLSYLLLIVLMNRARRRIVIRTTFGAFAAVVMLMAVVPPRSLMGLLGWPCFVAMLTMIAAMIAGLPSYLYQQLHEQTVLQRPAGMLSTEAPPEMLNSVVEELLPAAPEESTREEELAAR